jgi:hypothetical protein
LLKPALSNVYAKIGGKTESHAKIFVSKAVVRDLSWFVLHVKQSDGVYLFEDVDACMFGIGFFLEQSQEGFQSALPHNPPRDTIFYFEALAIVSIVDTVAHRPSVPTHLLVYSDNTNTVDIFYSLRSLPPYNDLLKFTVFLLLEYNISLIVVHVPGVNNTIADALSRFEDARALLACPGLSISPFQPPQVTLGLGA